jgi:hypothetical protein
MKVIYLLTTTLLSVSLAFSPSRIIHQGRSHNLTLTRPFTVAAFQSLYPPGSGNIPGIRMTARVEDFGLIRIVASVALDVAI